jgi:hypothetical protein
MAAPLFSSDWLAEFNRQATRVPAVDPDGANDLTALSRRALDPDDDAAWVGALELGLFCSDLPAAGVMHCRAQIASTGQLRLLPPNETPLAIATFSEREFRRWAGRPVRELISSAYHDELTIRGDVSQQALFIAAHADALAHSRFVIPDWPTFSD